MLCITLLAIFSRKHTSRDVIFSDKNLPKNTNIITLHDLLEPLKQAFLASRVASCFSPYRAPEASGAEIHEK